MSDLDKEGYWFVKKGYGNGDNIQNDDWVERSVMIYIKRDRSAIYVQKRHDSEVRKSNMIPRISTHPQYWRIAAMVRYSGYGVGSTCNEGLVQDPETWWRDETLCLGTLHCYRGYRPIGRLNRRLLQRI